MLLTIKPFHSCKMCKKGGPHTFLYPDLLSNHKYKINLCFWNILQLLANMTYLFADIHRGEYFKYVYSDSI